MSTLFETLNATQQGIYVRSLAAAGWSVDAIAKAVALDAASVAALLKPRSLLTLPHRI